MLIEAEENEKILYIRHFTEKLNADKKQVKEVIQELKNSKAIQTEYGVNDDGMLSGRGYVLTYEITRWSIREWLQVLKNLQKEEGNL